MNVLVDLGISIVKKVWDMVAPEDQAAIEAQMMTALGDMRATRKDTGEAHEARLAETLAMIDEAKKTLP